MTRCGNVGVDSQRGATHLPKPSGVIADSSSHGGKCSGVIAKGPVVNGT